MNKKISKTIIVLGSMVSTAILLVCISLVARGEFSDINILCLAAERIVCFSVFAGFSADVLLHKKAR